MENKETTSDQETINHDHNLPINNENESGSEQYAAGTSKYSLHGPDYNLKLLMLFALKATISDFEFRLATEMAEAGKFDDLVISYKDGNGDTIYRLLQTKHKEDTENSKIKYSDLTSDNDKNPFSLRKYYISYIEIIRNEKFQAKKREFIIFTNADFDFSESTTNEGKIDFNDWFTQITEKDEFLNIGDESKRYRFNKDENRRKEIKDILSQIFKDSLGKQIRKEKKHGKAKFLPADDSDKINGFLDEIVFAVNQPSGKDLEECVKNEIGKSYNPAKDFIYSEFFKFMYDWMQNCVKINKKLMSSYLLQNRVKKFIENFKSKAASLSISTLTQSHKAKVENCKVQFKDSTKVCQDVKEFLNYTNKQEKLLIIHQEYSLLSEIKVWQIVGSKSENISSVIYASLKSLSSSADITKTAIDAFSNEATEFIIIEIDDLTEANSKIVLTELINVFSNSESFKKRAVFIVSRKVKNDFKAFLPVELTEYKTITDCDNNIADLTEDSQREILERNVIFQGVKVKLAECVNDNSKHLINGEILLKLLESEENLDQNLIKVGDDLTDSIYRNVENYYIQRRFIRFIKIDSSVRETTEFYITDNEEIDESKLKENQDILLISEKEEHFNKLKEKFNKYNIHHVKEIRNNYIWQRTHGSQSKLRKYYIKIKDYHCTKSLEKQTKITDIEGNKALIIAAEPGMGKSTLLTHLAVKTKQSDPSKWIVKINLINYTSEFRSLTELNFKFNKETVVNFLSYVAVAIHDKKKIFLDFIHSNYNEVLKNYDKEGGCFTLFATQLFKAFYNAGNIILLFDGFDEISPDYKETVINLLQAVKDSEALIWITTRPYNIQHELEDKVDLCSYYLKPFSEEDQKEFLINYFKTNMNYPNTDDEFDEERTNVFINELLNRFSKSTNDKEKNFVGIPLQMKMLATVFLDIFKEFYLSNESCINSELKRKLNEKLNLVTLYEKFFEIKFNEVYFGEKLADLDQSNLHMKDAMVKKREAAEESHRRLAVYAIVEEAQINNFKLLSKKERKKISKEIKEIEIAEEKLGIIERVINEKPIFVHATFGEYFFSLFIFEKLQDEDYSDDKIWSFFFHHVLLKEKYQVTRVFLNYLMENRNEQFNSSEIKSHLKEVAEKASKQKTMVDTPLHVTAREGLENIFNFLVDSENFNFSNYAGREYLNKLKREKDKDSNISNYISYLESRIDNIVNIRDQYNKTALYYAIENGHKNIVETILEKGGFTYLKNRDANTILLASANGHIEVTKTLIRHLKRYSLIDIFEIIRDEIGRSAWDFYTTLEDISENISNIYQRPTTTIEDLTLLQQTQPGQITCKGAMAEAAIIDKQEHNQRTTIPSHHASYNSNLYFVNHRENVNSRDAKGNTPLHWAALKGDTEEAEALIQLGANINEENDHKYTPLHCASYQGNLDLVKYLIQQKADVNYRDTRGHTALHFAAIAGNADVAEVLLQHGANINEEDNIKEPPVSHTSVLGTSKIVEHLTKQKIKVNARNEDGSTPLHWAAVNSNTELAKVLIQHGANINEEGEGKATPLHYASKFGSSKMVKYLIQQKANVNSKNIRGDTPLHWATQTDNTEVAEILILHGANINEENDDKATPLHFASKFATSEMVKYLIQQKANVNSRDSIGDTPLHWAAETGKTEVAEVLIQHGANINGENDNKATPLHSASMLGTSAMVKYLLQQKANVNSRDAVGRTPLHWVALTDNTETAELLIQHGANINDEDVSKVTPLHRASKYGASAMVKYLLQQKVYVNSKSSMGYTPLHWAAKKSNTEVAEVLIQQGANINEETDHKSTPLLIASQFGTPEMVKYLLKNKASINSRDNDGDTALHCAASGGKTEVAEVLIQHGANINDRNNNKETPLLIALKEGNSDFVKYLLDHNADVNSRDAEGNTPVDLAVLSDNSELAEVLRKQKRL